MKAFRLDWPATILPGLILCCALVAATAVMVKIDQCTSALILLY